MTAVAIIVVVLVCGLGWAGVAMIGIKHGRNGSNGENEHLGAGKIVVVVLVAALGVWLGFVRFR